MLYVIVKYFCTCTGFSKEGFSDAVEVFTPVTALLSCLVLSLKILSAIYRCYLSCSLYMLILYSVYKLYFDHVFNVNMFDILNTFTSCFELIQVLF